MDKEKQINDFINKNYDLIIQYYIEEGRDMDCEEDELIEYASDCVGFTFVGTLDDIDEEGIKDYHIICKDDTTGLYAIETFDGLTYDFITM